MPIAQNMSLADTTTSTLPPNIEYTHSKLYQRTLKAQKALEKERAKAAAKGKISKVDLQVQTQDLTSRADRRKSNAGSFVSDVGGFRSRSSLGWFRSSSEATLPLPPPPASFAAPPIPTSRSVTQLPLPSPTYSLPLPPSPGLDPKYATQPQPVPHPSPEHRSQRTPSRQGPNSATPSRMSSPAPTTDNRRSREASSNSIASRGTRPSAATPIPTAVQMLAASVPLPETPKSETPQAFSLPPSASDQDLPRAPSSNSIDRKVETPIPIPTEPSSPVKLIPKSASRNSLKTGHARMPSSSSRQSDHDMESIATPPPRRRDPSLLAERGELTNPPPRVSSIYADTGVEPILMPQQRAVDPPATSLTTASTESLPAAPLTPPLDEHIKPIAQAQFATKPPVDLPAPIQDKTPALLGPPMIEAIKRPRKSSFRFFGVGKKDENERLANPTMKDSTNSNRSTQSAPVLLSKSPSRSIRQTFFGRSQRAVPTLPPSVPSSPKSSSRTAPFSNGSKSMPASPIRSSNIRPREPMSALAFDQQQQDLPSAQTSTTTLSQSSTSASTSTRLSKKKSTVGQGQAPVSRPPSGFFASFGRQRSKSSAAAVGSAPGISTRPPLPAGPLPRLPSPLPPGPTKGNGGQGPPAQTAKAKAKVNGNIREFP
ncbi:BZ3500_MvSof-1268-A1-R1_Chr7-1g09372 [Microbotryum saponariae]|uniref:BZ3500_MvSof-1268-A1-R1_Chr7-1g09372 protein n=1 Tax=Microbotryum saponariae TaxID=289078 RepID=A0A2X0MWY5_9BASI|nr:BZ3501_MvSof-1269-A2-R1_Chr7-1g09077 [Microbotryum saponariae]SDA03314.1 BZ3500_MvSof-1268-A1-R1_Chr7-1g09372 [Microbotryum saponariae]